MTDVLFIQGAGDNVHDEWDNKLVHSLQRALGAGYDVRYPRMPNEANPQYATWKPAIEDEIAHLKDGAIVIGHSVGGTTLIHVLSDITPVIVLAAIVLVSAPFIGDGGWPSDELVPKSDLGAHLPKGVPVFLYHGDVDDVVPVAHLDLYSRAIPQAHVTRLKGRDHQLNDDLREIASSLTALVDTQFLS